MVRLIKSQTCMPVVAIYQKLEGCFFFVILIMSDFAFFLFSSSSVSLPVWILDACIGPHTVLVTFQKSNKWQMHRHIWTCDKQQNIFKINNSCFFHSFIPSPCIVCWFTRFPEHTHKHTHIQHTLNWRHLCSIGRARIFFRLLLFLLISTIVFISRRWCVIRCSRQ